MKMLTAVANTAGGFDYSGEYYTACYAFLVGTDPSMPDKTLVHPDKLNIDRQSMLPVSRLKDPGLDSRTDSAH